MINHHYTQNFKLNKKRERDRNQNLISIPAPARLTQKSLKQVQLDIKQLLFNLTIESETCIYVPDSFEKLLISSMLVVIYMFQD